MLFTIAVDGPVGAGKSSVADGVAKKLQILHLDTGAMYRALAFYALQKNMPLDDEEALKNLCGHIMPEVCFVEGKQQTYIDGENVTERIRTPQVSMAASSIAKDRNVRKAMVACQQKIAQRQSMIMDGRDIGTCVLPQATLKIYLNATPQVRAKRRYDEMIASGKEAVYEDVLADVIKRDSQDMNREVDPLRPADDALILDSSHLTQQQVVDSIIRRLHMRLHKRLPREEKFTPMYAFLKGLTRIGKNSFLPFEVHRPEYAELDAPYLIIANHNSLLDPVLLVDSCDRYHIRFLGKSELTKSKIGKWFFEKCLRMISVDRGNSDFAAFKTCVKVLREGHPLCIFPEGTRHKSGIMQHAETGTAMIALMSKQPILPVFLTERPRLFRKTHVLYGAPFWPQDVCEGAVNNENCAKLIAHIQKIYSDLYHEACRNGFKCYKDLQE